MTAPTSAAPRPADTAPVTGKGRTADSTTGRAISLAPVRSRRRPWLLGLGGLLASIGALTMVWLVGAAGQRQEVLAVRSEIAYGQQILAEDLTIARVSVDPGIAVLPASARTTVPGQVATTRLVPGMLLTAGMVEPTGEPGPGRVLVPIAMPAERIPAGGLRAGDRLLAVDADAGSPAGGISATVLRVGPMDVNGVTVIDVTTTAASGPALAVAAANGHVALVVEPSGR